MIDQLLKRQSLSFIYLFFQTDDQPKCGAAVEHWADQHGEQSPMITFDCESSL